MNRQQGDRKARCVSQPRRGRNLGPKRVFVGASAPAAPSHEQATRRERLIRTGSMRMQRTCGFFGCTLPDRHAGLHAIVTSDPGRRNMRSGRLVRSDLDSPGNIQVGPAHQAELPSWAGAAGRAAGRQRAEDVRLSIDAEHIAEEASAALRWAVLLASRTEGCSSSLDACERLMLRLDDASAARQLQRPAELPGSPEKNKRSRESGTPEKSGEVAQPLRKRARTSARSHPPSFVALGLAPCPVPA